MMGKLFVYSGIVLAVLLLSIWSANHKERQCVEIGGKSIYSFAGFHTSCVGQAS